MSHCVGCAHLCATCLTPASALVQEEEFYCITWEAKKEVVFELPTGGAAIMRQVSGWAAVFDTHAAGCKPYTAYMGQLLQGLLTAASPHLATAAFLY